VVLLFILGAFVVMCVVALFGDAFKAVRLLSRPERQPVRFELLIDEHGHSLQARCSRCLKRVDNFDPDHRVSAIMRGGRGVECVRRGDIEPWQGGPLRRRSEDDERGLPTPD
jgi:hypothetical protein